MTGRRGLGLGLDTTVRSPSSPAPLRASVGPLRSSLAERGATVVGMALSGHHLLHELAAELEASDGEEHDHRPLRRGGRRGLP